MKPVLVLAIDHRNSLRNWYASIVGVPDPVVLADTKAVVAEGLLTALPVDGTPMLLADEEYGGEAIRRVRDSGTGVSIVIAAERSGQPEFSFEYGAEFGEHIRKIAPDVVKALVRYNPDADWERNARSRAGLRELTRWLAAEGMPLMLELLVPPEPGQRGPRYDTDVRPGLTLRAIDELADLAPAFWKVEPQPDVAGYRELAGKVAGSQPLVLGRGEDAAAVADWIAAAAPAFGGFAVGRTMWADPLADWLTGRTDRQRAVARIAANYRYFTGIFLEHQGGHSDE